MIEAVVTARDAQDRQWDREEQDREEVPKSHDDQTLSRTRSVPGHRPDATVGPRAQLELDPSDSLGAPAVAAADEWVALGGYERLEDARRARAASWARPIGSHKRLATQ